MAVALISWKSPAKDGTFYLSVSVSLSLFGLFLLSISLLLFRFIFLGEWSSKLQSTINQIVEIEKLNLK